MAVRAFLEPGCSLGGACKVVHHQMHVARYGDTASNLVEEMQELLLAVVAGGAPHGRSILQTIAQPLAGSTSASAQDALPAVPAVRGKSIR